MRFDRGDSLARLGSEAFDVLVVGGGITGVGVALDAATRGLSTALVERHDLASGTSSRSSKLVHGGLRYLQQGDVRLVYEALAERQLLRRNAPHLVELLPFLIPVMTSGGTVTPRMARGLRSALWAYDLTGGARIGRFHERVTAAEALERFPTLDPSRLAAGFIYHDARTDDARLTLAVARTAAAHGAAVANRCEVVSLARTGERITGAIVRPSGEEPFEVRARVVVNAGGVWSDELRAMELGAGAATLRPAKGVHITVPWDRVRNRTAATLAVPGDGRSIFVVPYGEHTYIGTTDTDHAGSLEDPRCSAEDLRYLLDAVNASLASPLGADDVLASWAGLRPLVRATASGRTADLSRRHRVTSSAGVVTVTGGKLTTYRRMAAGTVDAVVEQLDGRSRARSRTRNLRLDGADGLDDLTGDRLGPAAAALGVEPALLSHLVGRYGGTAPDVAALVRDRPALGRPLSDRLPFVAAEAVHAVRHEMATTLDDVLSRRIPARWLDARAAAGAAPAVAALIGPELGWSPADVAREVDGFTAAALADVACAG